MFNLFGFKPKKEANEETKTQDTESDLKKYNEKFTKSISSLHDSDYIEISSLYDDISGNHFKYLDSKKIESDDATVNKKNSLIKNYKIEVRHILDNILFKIADATKTNTRSELFFGNDFFNKDLINKKFKYVCGFYYIPDYIPEIPGYLLSNNIKILVYNSDILKDKSKLRNYTFTLTEKIDDDDMPDYENPDNEIEFTIDDGTKIAFKKTLSKIDYPGNSIYGHIFQQIEDEPNDAKSQPSKELSIGGKRTRRRNRRRRHQKSRKNRRSRRH